MKKLLSLCTLLSALTIVSCGKDEPVQPETQAALTSVSEITSASDRSALVGRQVSIDGSVVRSVVGDYFFWVGDSGATIPVALEGELRGIASEGNLRIRRGQRLQIVGTVRLVSTAIDEDPLLDAEEKRDMEAAGVYIAADSVTEK